MSEFKILTLDGGGARGLFSVNLLKNLEKEYNISMTDHFDLIVGTSTGSIIASGLSMGIGTENIEKMYLEEMEIIFKKNILKNGILESKYSTEPLKKALEKVFKHKDFKNAKTDLMITTTNIVTGEPLVIKSKNPKGMKLIDSILSSCAAPLFFDPLKIDDLHIYSDGALWANNPGLVAFSEALSRHGYHKDIKDIKILSVGAGEEPLENKYKNKTWGISYWIDPLIKVMLQLSSRSSDNMLSRILDEEQYVRLDYKTESIVDIDTVDKDVERKVIKIIKENKEKLDTFFSIRKIEESKNEINEVIKKKKNIGFIGKIFKKKSNN